MRREICQTMHEKENYSFHVAGEHELLLAEALVDRVYRARLGLERPAGPAFRIGPQQVTVYVRRREQPVATLTLQSHAFETRADRIPLELEELYDLEGSPHDPARVAEVRRVASVGGHSGGVRALYRFAAELCRRAGIEAWIGLVEAQSSMASEASLVQRVVGAHGLLSPSPSLPLRGNANPERWYPEHEGTAAYRAVHLRALPLPGHVAAFAGALGARAIGVPTLHPRYRRLVVPMRADLDNIPRPAG